MGIAGANGSVGIGGGIDVGASSSSTTHSGTFCNSFAEPLISEQIISFKSGDAIFGNVSRGNMQSYTNISQNTTTFNDNSWGVSLDASVALNKSRHATVNGDNANIDMGDDITNNQTQKPAKKTAEQKEQEKQDKQNQQKAATANQIRNKLGSGSSQSNPLQNTSKSLMQESANKFNQDTKIKYKKTELGGDY